jgi:hypothetical protein
MDMATAKPSDDVVSHRIGDELILVHLGTNRFYSLNRTGARLWELIAEGKPASEVRRRLTSEFGVDERTLSEELDAFLGVLASERLLFTDGPH